MTLLRLPEPAARPARRRARAAGRERRAGARASARLVARRDDRPGEQGGGPGDRQSERAVPDVAGPARRSRDAQLRRAPSVAAQLPRAHQRLDARHRLRLHRLPRERPQASSTSSSAADLTWKAYMEDMPKPCFRGAGSGGYAKKHNPFAYYDDVAGDPKRCRRIVPFDQLAADLKGGRLPTYVFISPNLCNDMHDCDVATGDRFLARWCRRSCCALGPQRLPRAHVRRGRERRGCCGGSVRRAHRHRRRRPARAPRRALQDGPSTTTGCCAARSSGRSACPRWPHQPTRVTAGSNRSSAPSPRIR